MVTFHRSRDTAPSLAEPRTQRMRRRAKAAKLPPAASNQAGPELSAREASMSPATSKAGLKPFIAYSTCLSSSAASKAMLAPPSDNFPRPPGPVLRYALARRGGA